jgi:hypothetical protein
MAFSDRHVPERPNHALTYGTGYCDLTNLNPSALCEWRRLFELAQEEGKQFIGQQEGCEEATRTGEREVKTATVERGNRSQNKMTVGANGSEWSVCDDAG